MARLRESHGQRLDSTATLTTNFNRRKLVLRIPIGDHQLILFLTALISTRDSLLLTERPKLFHTHKFTITASLIIKWFRRRIQTGAHLSIPSPTAQTLMRDSP